MRFNFNPTRWRKPVSRKCVCANDEKHKSALLRLFAPLKNAQNGVTRCVRFLENFTYVNEDISQKRALSKLQKDRKIVQISLCNLGVFLGDIFLFCATRFSTFLIQFLWFASKIDLSSFCNCSHFWIHFSLPLFFDVSWHGFSAIKHEHTLFWGGTLHFFLQNIKIDQIWTTTTLG